MSLDFDDPYILIVLEDLLPQGIALTVLNYLRLALLEFIFELLKNLVEDFSMLLLGTMSNVIRIELSDERAAREEPLRRTIY